MSIEDVVRAALTGGQSHSEGQTLGERVSELRAKHGSGRAAARAAGMAESTFRRIAKTGRAKEANAEKVSYAVRESRLSSTLTDATLTITATDRSNGRSRTISADKLKLKPGTVERMRAAYLRGDDQAAAKEMLAGIGDPWYRGWLTPGSTLAQTGTTDGSGGGPQGAAARRDRDESSSGGGGGAGSGGGGGGSGGGGGDYEDDWSDLAYEGDDVDSDYGATIGGIA